MALSKTNISRLTFLSLSNKKVKLGNNRIGDNGCEQLAKGQWPHLKELYLRNYAYIQGTTESLKRAVNTSVKRTGKNSKNYTFVTVD